MAKTQRFTGKHVDLERLANRIETYLQENKFEVAFSKDNTGKRIFIQARKVSLLRTAAGARRSTDIMLQGSPNNFHVTIGTGEWGKNLLVSAPLFLVPLVGISVTIAKLYTGKKFESNLWRFVKDQIGFLSQSKTISAPSKATAKTPESEKQVLEYDCDYVGGFPGWSRSVNGGQLILERSKDSSDRIIFVSPDSKKISINASSVTEANIISGKVGYHKDDKMIQIKCTDSKNRTIRPIFNIHDDIIRGVLAGIDELVGEDKVLRQLMHTKVDVKIKECKKCGLEIPSNSKFCYKCGKKQ